MPFLTSPTPNNPFYTTTHGWDFPQRKRFWLRSKQETMQCDPAWLQPTSSSISPIWTKRKRATWKGSKKVRSMKVRAPVTIKIEPGTENPPSLTIKKHNDIFVVVYKLSDTVYTNQTSAFLITSQWGCWFIMVCIHLNANYIFCKLMKNKTKGEMITAYQRMVNRMKLSTLGLKHH